MAALPPPTADLEKALGSAVAGVDEVGRGCLAGPVVAAAVILPPSLLFQDIGLRDSKTLSRGRRQQLSARLIAEATVSIASASVAEIDARNILQASLLAMKRAVKGLSSQPACCLVDGNVLPDLPMAAQAVIKGDQRSRSIAAASIVAKVHRDALMQQLHAEHPAYSWDTNAGYGTAAHRRALALVGPSPHHRRSFKLMPSTLC